MDQIVIEFESMEHLEQELEKNLLNGGAFAPGASGVEEHAPCEVVLVHPEDKTEMRLPARVVWVASKGEPGVGVAFSDFGKETKEALEKFVREGGESPGADDKKKAAPPSERLRGLSATEQKKIAREGSPAERMVLERIYGKAVWETLLRNPKVTVPEVARIARMGSLPRPLLELIVSNTTWLAASPIRLALLSNPRMTGEMINKVLRLFPRNELRMIPKRLSLPQPVRTAARKLLSQY